ncbi:MAG: PIN domain-containing protein [Methylobacteriaceae bacterium]|nr:PIN domain-containing protein [Rhodoblastus sp.]MCC0006046.1 PIN domain-containing protein [Methylobacteriaceae bacterium]
MNGDCFLDTNILLYSISDAPDERAKRERAIALLRTGRCALSAQVIQEFYWQATRPTKSGPLAHEEALALVQSFMRFRFQDTTAALIIAALDIKPRYRLSYWDAAIVAAAQALGCGTLYSEDMAHGMSIGATRVVNPFL